MPRKKKLDFYSQVETPLGKGGQVGRWWSVPGEDGNRVIVALPVHAGESDYQNSLVEPELAPIRCIAIQVVQNLHTLKEDR